MAKIAEDAIVWCVIVSLFFAGPGVFAFGGPLFFLRRGIAAVKQYLKQRKQPEENAGIRKCLWKGIGFILFGTLGIVVVVYLFAGAVTSGMIFVILYFLTAGPALLFWAAVLLWLHLRAPQAGAGRENKTLCLGRCVLPADQSPGDSVFGHFEDRRRAVPA